MTTKATHNITTTKSDDILPPTTTVGHSARYIPEMFIPHRALGDGREIYFPCVRCTHYRIGKRCTFYPEAIPDVMLAGAVSCPRYGKSYTQN